MKQNKRIYTVTTNPMGQEIVFFEENGFINCFLTSDTNNSDYRQYLKDLENESANG